ncbi:RICIN domain-containing protein [Streptomyces sp. NPDC046928]|uniref:RICIN domain-containing protein n=1 Tax=Streptomyces sp. NPDC046928 TaxID=3155021 RepID=UPI0033F58380
MPTPHPPRPPYPPPGGLPEESDEGLAARLRGRTDSEAAPSVALLMARHWDPVHAYAVICLAAPAGAASHMVTAAAFHQVLDRLALGEPAAALRPRLLVAVRDTVRQWSGDERITGTVPELGKPSGGRGMRTAKSLTPENRRLADRSFQALPGLARCLLWHTEVEAEPLNVPAGLLGLDPVTARAALEQARDTFREGCVHAHRELAPTKDCRFYNRLLDVPIRRGGALLPDVEAHLAHCRYCRNAAEQLSHFEGGLGVLIAESVLGWGARRYLESRPGRTPSRTRGAARHGAARRRLLARVPAQVRGAAGPSRPSRTLLTGVGVASAGLMALLLVAGLLTEDDGVDPAASATAGSPGTRLPPAVSSAPPGTAQAPAVPSRTRLRNAAAGLCLGVQGEPGPGAGTELATCSDDLGQKWSYDTDGRLRSAADPDLCLDSRADAGVVILGRCAPPGSGRAEDVRYDLTVRGEVLPRWDERLALAAAAPDPGADIVVKVRDRSDTQRWLTDPPASATPDALSSAVVGPAGARGAGPGERGV